MDGAQMENNPEHQAWMRGLTGHLCDDSGMAFEAHL